MNNVNIYYSYRLLSQCMNNVNISTTFIDNLVSA